MRRLIVNLSLAILTSRIAGSNYFLTIRTTKHLAHSYFVLPSLTQKRCVLLRRNISPSATTGEATNIWSSSVLVAAISNFSPNLMTVITPLSLAR